MGSIGRRGVGPMRPWLKTPPVNGAWEYPNAFRLPSLPKPLTMFMLKSGVRGAWPVRARVYPINPAQELLINGITRDKNGTIVGSATVDLYRTLTDQMVETVVSNASTGAFSFSAVGLGQQYYIVAYKAGSPDIAGTTLNTLTSNGAMVPADTSVYLRDPTTADSGGGGGTRVYGLIG